jgi:protein gp37
MKTLNNKPNCWEITSCGRQSGGDRVDELGICPAAVDTSCDGINSGVNAGRFCWAITGTLCGSRVHDIFALKIEECLECRVLQRVADEEGEDFVLHKEDTQLADRKPKQPVKSST